LHAADKISRLQARQTTIEGNLGATIDVSPGLMVSIKPGTQHREEPSIRCVPRGGVD
jgi:hypothetical protein